MWHVCEILLFFWAEVGDVQDSESADSDGRASHILMIFLVPFDESLVLLGNSILV